MAKADRFLRTGDRVPVIYPGTAVNLAQAMRDTRDASAAIPGQHELYGVHDGERSLVQVYSGGVLTWWLAENS